MAKFRSHFTRETPIGRTHSSRDFRSREDAEADARFWTAQNHNDPRVSAKVEEIED